MGTRSNTVIYDGDVIMGTCYTNEQAKRIAMIKAAVIKVKTRKAFAVRVRIEDLLVARVTLDKGTYT